MRHGVNALGATLFPHIARPDRQGLPGVIGVEQSAGDRKPAEPLRLGGNGARIMTVVDALLSSPFAFGAAPMKPSPGLR